MNLTSRMLRPALALVAASGALTCGGDSSQDYGDPTLPTIQLNSTPKSVSTGGSALLTWSSTNTVRCDASGGWHGHFPVQGSELVTDLTATTSFTLECQGPGGSVSSTVVADIRPDGFTNVFPLRIASNGRYLEDASGVPFLLHGDSPWSLIVQLSREDVELYLNDRKERGFNTILVNLIEKKFSNDPPRNWYGDVPFLSVDDFSTPNEAYFAHADWVLERAGDLGFTVLLVPAYLGFRGGDQGWYRELLAAGFASVEGYGRFLGQRYRAMKHIIWTHGGDYNPPDRTVVRMIAEAIHAADPDRLATAHCARETAAYDYWDGESWLTLNNAYTGGPVQLESLHQYALDGPIPFFLIEALYENEHSVRTDRLRAQAYHALLSGASGHLFGSNPVWHFDGPGLYPAPVTWKEALDGPGSRSMERVWELFATLPWWTLVPDTGHALLVGGVGEEQEQAVAAVAIDGGLAVLYLPSVRDVSLAFGPLSGTMVNATWYDPSSGRWTPAPGSPFPAAEGRTLRPPGLNEGGDPDWVLVLQSQF